MQRFFLPLFNDHLQVIKKYLLEVGTHRDKRRVRVKFVNYFHYSHNYTGNRPDRIMKKAESKFGQMDVVNYCEMQHGKYVEHGAVRRALLSYF